MNERRDLAATPFSSGGKDEEIMEWNEDRPECGTPEFARAQALIKRIARSTDLAERRQLAEALPKSWQEIETVKRWVLGL